VAAMRVEEFFSKGFSYAVVGATTDHEKYGYTVLKDLSRAGYSVTGVNPKHREIDDIHCVPTLKDVQPKPDVVVLVVPPPVGLGLLSEVKALDIEKVWFQPGAESQEIRVKAAELGLTAMADGSCIMVARRRLGL